ncbi:unnamed protein product [Arabidopsis halleri]
MAAAIPARDPKWMDLFERNFVIKFLFGLNDSYEHIRESIVMMDPLPDLEKALHMVIQHEHQQEMKQTPQSGSVVFQMSSSNIQSPSYESGYSVNQADNYLGNNEVIGAVSGGYKPRQRPVCTYCGLQGHLVTRCYKLHGYPPGYKPPSRSYGSPRGTPRQVFLSQTLLLNSISLGLLLSFRSNNMVNKLTVIQECRIREDQKTM